MSVSLDSLSCRVLCHRVGELLVEVPNILHLQGGEGEGLGKSSRLDELVL